MKRIFATFLLMLSVTLSFAQKQDDNSAERRYYCEIKCYEKGVKSNYKVFFEFGSVVSKEVWNRSNCKVAFVNENGKLIKFKSMVDAANFLVERGWILDKVYSTTYTNKKNIKHWLFYKDAEGYEELKEGFVTKKEYRMMKREEKALQEQNAVSQ